MTCARNTLLYSCINMLISHKSSVVIMLHFISFFTSSLVHIYVAEAATGVVL